MAKILLAESAGFCFGVERAIDLAYETASHQNGHSRRIATLGPLIHNPEVVSSLEERGIHSMENLEQAASQGVDTLIFRSHGVTAEAEEKAKELGLKTVDATCPYVLTSQRYAVSAAKRGQWVVIVGNPSHPEILGIVSRAALYTDKIRVIARLEEVEQIPAGLDVAILAQTTFPPSLYDQIVETLEKKSSSMKVYHTICSATEERQRDSAKLAELSDCVIVIGGRNSANTAKLVDICKKIQSRTYSIETAPELCSEWFLGSEKIGVTAGASTPRSTIEEVIARVKDAIGIPVEMEIVRGVEGCKQH